MYKGSKYTLNVIQIMEEVEATITVVVFFAFEQQLGDMDCVKTILKKHTMSTWLRNFLFRFYYIYISILSLCFLFHF